MTGRVPSEPGSRPTDQAPSGLDAPRFDPSRGPRRAHVLKLDIGADSIEDLRYALRAIETDLIMGRLTNGCSGSPSVGWSHSYSHDPEMTHDRYFADVDAFLARDSDRSAEGGETRSGSTEGESAGPKDIAPNTPGAA